MEFEDVRADISHTLLRNGVFSRLGASFSLVELLSPSVEQSQNLVQASLLSLNEHGNIRKAAQTWLTGDGRHKSVRCEVLELIKMARNISGICPDTGFPDEEVVKQYITVCDRKMAAVNDMLESDSMAQVKWFEEFWPNALGVYNVVHSFGINCSDDFWCVFRSEANC
jgi:hypothetical protein